MEGAEEEVPLAGGNVNASVVRVGETVRRAMSPHHENVHRLLAHLAAQGFDRAPRFLGIDEKGREVLSRLPGSPAFPDDMWTGEAALVEAVHMLRAYHDATEDFDPGEDGGWAFAYPEKALRQVICHNDFAPYNMLFEDGLPTGIVDFDLAGPGPRLRDLAYLAHWMVPLSFADPQMRAHAVREMEGGCLRLKLLCGTYGTEDFVGLIRFVGEVLAHMGDEAATRAMVGPTAAARLADGGHFEHWKREAAAFETQRATLLRALR